jgi:hypothetical protein
MSAPCVLKALDETGDTELTWDPNRPDEVAAARAMWDRLVGEKKYLAYRVEGKERTKIRSFDPQAPKIVLTPQLVGG